MDFSTWEPIYEEILKDFGFERAEDERSASILSDILRDLDIKRAYERIKLTIEGRRVIVCGKAHTLIEELKKEDLKERTIISADGATSSLLSIGIVPHIIVTDLDGDVEDLLKANKSGSLVVIHAHGDNIDKIKRYSSRFRNAIGTTQARPFDKIYNFGGFTDGDRCVFLAKYFGAEEIKLVGFYFNDPNVGEVKRKKLKWAERLLREEEII
jgi:hypothetical protein